MVYADTTQHISPPIKFIPAWLNHAEKNFILFLADAIADKGIIFTKVPVDNVLENVSLFDEYPHYNFDNEVFDFVICHPADLSVLCVIKLDSRRIPKQINPLCESTHESICVDANIPFIVIPARCGYDTQQLRRILYPYISR